jgi:protein-L-isoaspartate(D-aspartate) O-methyltransferase
VGLWLVVFLVPAAAVLHVMARSAGPRTTSRPATAASAPASRPQKKWSPPRFKARFDERNKMGRVILNYGVKDLSILRAMVGVPRHFFVPRAIASRAYYDTPLPIGFGQTISQPYMVAVMTMQLRLKPTSRVLEIGTGSGYQAAVLTEFTPHVYSIEIVKPLADAAKMRFKNLGYHVIKTKCGDGYYGWPSEAPFDAIVVTCAAGQIPPPLVKQLANGGRMVIPVGGAFSRQSLMLVEKDKNGRVRSRSLMGVRFVPLRRKDVSVK